MFNAKELDIGTDAWGHAFEIELPQSIHTHEEAYHLMDEFCGQEQLRKLGDAWRTISFSIAKKMLQDGLSYDIAFSNSRISKAETVENILSNILSKLNTEEIKFCFTNCSKSPWEGKGYGMNNITQQTFDIAVVMIDSKKMLFTFFMSED